MTIEQLAKTTDLQWVALGKHYGYPDCCIVDFCMTHWTARTINQEKVHNNQGFVPCPNCADKIVEGKAKIEDLIVDRKSKSPYPVDIMDLLPYEEQVKEVKRIVKEYFEENVNS